VLTTHLVNGFHYLVQTPVHRLNGGDCRLHIAGMAHHVRIGDIANDDIILARADRCRQLFCQVGGAHFRLQIIRGDFGRRDQDALFEGIRVLAATVEKKCDVRILFGFSNAQLSHALLGQQFAQQSRQS
jgi:hypothetical protein